jgi:hypothetical protein
VTLVQQSTVGAQLTGQGLEEVDRIELRLVLEDRATDVRHRYVEPLLPAHGQTRRQRRLVLGTRRRLLAGGRRVGDRRAALHRDAVLVAEVEQPRLARTVPLHVRRHEPLRVVPPHP